MSVFLSPRGRAIVDRVREFPGESEIQIARALLGPDAVQQQVNAEMRRLVASGILLRDEGTSPYRYRLNDGSMVSTSTPSPKVPVVEALSEDEIKRVLKARLESEGWITVIKMGHERGIDIEANRNGARWIIEVKGPGSLQPMRVNYFLAILGETLQRMDDPSARYSIALPDLPQFRGLWTRLPLLAKERTTIDALFVHPDGSVEEVC